MENNEAEKYFRHIRTMCKNHCSKGTGDTEAKNACTCYPEGPGWSDVISTHKEPSRNAGFGGKGGGFSEAAASMGSEGVGLSRRPLEKRSGAQEREDETNTDSREKWWLAPGWSGFPGRVSVDWEEQRGTGWPEQLQQGL